MQLLYHKSSSGTIVQRNFGGKKIHKNRAVKIGYFHDSVLVQFYFFLILRYYIVLSGLIQFKQFLRADGDAVGIAGGCLGAVFEQSVYPYIDFRRFRIGPHDTGSTVEQSHFRQRICQCIRRMLPMP
jgi:hypothetical protein